MGNRSIKAISENVYGLNEKCTGGEDVSRIESACRWMSFQSGYVLVDWDSSAEISAMRSTRSSSGIFCLECLEEF